MSPLFFELFCVLLLTSLHIRLLKQFMTIDLITGILLALPENMESGNLQCNLYCLRHFFLQWTAIQTGNANQKNGADRLEFKWFQEYQC